MSRSFDEWVQRYERAGLRGAKLPTTAWALILGCTGRDVVNLSMLAGLLIWVARTDDYKLKPPYRANLAALRLLVGA